MPSATRFLLAARQCEIVELEQLARNCALVGVLGHLVHALQRERGLSNVFLSSRGQRFGSQRAEQADACAAAEAQVRAALGQLDTAAGHAANGSRLFSRVALVLHGLDALPALRARIARQELGAPEATSAFDKLVAGLLSVVFEAADAASDPEISRALVALFNLMQGKELAGQERAFGGRAFAAGCITPAGQQHWQHLVEVQQACLEAFAGFSGALPKPERHGAGAAAPAQLQRLRHVAASSRGPLDPELSDAWYRHCTQRIDALRVEEERLAARLRALCERRIAQARADLRDQRTMLEAFHAQARVDGANALGPYGPHLERSVLALVQEQARRLQAMADELEEVRAGLHERKLVERAKGLLMAHRNLSEDEAYKALRRMAMNQNRRLADVAQAVLSLADVLPVGAR